MIINAYPINELLSEADVELRASHPTLDERQESEHSVWYETI